MARSQIRHPSARHLILTLAGVIGLGAACSPSPFDPGPGSVASPADPPTTISVLHLSDRRAAASRWVSVDPAGISVPHAALVTPHRGGVTTLARGGRAPDAATRAVGAEQAIQGERANISFNGVPGRDGRLDTDDDLLFGAGDFSGSGGSRAIDTEYSPVGVRFELGGLVTTVGGGYNPDGSLNTGTQVVLQSIAYTGYPVSPVRIRFDRSQTYITFDLFAQIGTIGSAAPVTLRDAQGNIVRSFTLTYLDAILGGFSPTFLGGRFLVTSAIPFSSIEIGRTVEGGGWFFDNLAFEPEHLVRHVSIDAPDRVNPITPTLLRVAVLSGDGFDAGQIDPSSLELGDGFARPRDGSAQLTDVDRDGDLDLVASFTSNQVGLACDATRVVLSGKIRDGRLMWGADALTTRCRGAGPGH